MVLYLVAPIKEAHARMKSNDSFLNPKHQCFDISLMLVFSFKKGTGIPLTQLNLEIVLPLIHIITDMLTD